MKAQFYLWQIGVNDERPELTDSKVLINGSAILVGRSTVINVVTIAENVTW